MRRLGWLVLLALLVPSSLAAQAPGRIQTPTRFVTIFSNLENQLMDALVANNRAAASRLLTDDFAQWTPDPPGSPTPREDWLRTDRTDLTDFRILQMSAKEMGTHVAVSFVLATGVRAFYIVDIWQKSEADWRLSTRYLSAINHRPYRGDIRPTGKN